MRHHEESCDAFIPKSVSVFFLQQILSTVQRMKQEILRQIADRSLVAAITRDHARVWLLNEDVEEPVVVLNREEANIRHVRSAQENHGHASDIGEIPYFAELATVLSVGSNVVLVGHGTGKANAMNRFIDYLALHNEPLHHRIAATGNANIGAMTGTQIIQDARRKWRQAHI